MRYFFLRFLAVASCIVPFRISRYFRGVLPTRPSSDSRTDSYTDSYTELHFPVAASKS